MANNNQALNGADEIAKYHELLQAGVITEEEFNKKKAEIMSGQYKRLSSQNSAQDTITSTLKNKKIMIPLIIILISVIGVLIWSNVLFGNDKIAYDLMVKAANRFKYPSTVRIESGTVVDDSMFANISAENALGQRSTTCYWVSNDGYLLEDNSSACLGSSFQRALDTKKINKKLKAHFKDD